MSTVNSVHLKLIVFINMKFLNQIYCGVVLFGAAILITAAPHSELSLDPTDDDVYEYINENFDNEREELVFGNETDNDVEKESTETDEKHEEHYVDEELNPNWSEEDCEELCKIEIMKIYPKCDKWCKQMC